MPTLCLPSRRRAVALLAVLATIVCGTIWSPASRAAPRSRSPVYDLRSRSKILGRTAAEWTVEWWQWALSLPADRNPGFDADGTLGATAQRGPVWFLIGAFNSTSVSRTVTVPAGRAILLPLVNTEWDSVGLPSALSVEELRRKAAETIASVDVGALLLEIDGQAVSGVERGRVRAGPFQYWYPDANAGQANGLVSPRGIYAPALSDGYWAMLRPLPVGRHTVRWVASLGSPFDLTLDIRYTIDVVETVLE